MEPKGKGVLHVVATPIGNLGDASGRMRSTLEACDVVAAEDTRVARKLMSLLGITGKRTVSVRQHNERTAAAKLAKASGGGQIAYVCDAGTPGASDPGARLVEVLRGEGFEIRAVPGPSAVTAALSVSGFGDGGHVFGGFLPRGREKAVGRLRELGSLGLPVVLFEAPGRVLSTLAAVGEAFGEGARVCACSELTKMHESARVAGCAELAGELGRKGTPKGEHTLVVDTAAYAPGVPLQAMRVLKELGGALPPAKACKVAARLTGADPKTLYRLLSGEKRDAGSGPA